MGIKDLLQYLKSITKKILLEEIRKSTVAVDAYGWLHKGAIESSNNPVLGEDGYLSCCMSYLHLLHYYEIKVILVFDGCNLPAKLDVETKRQKDRDKFKTKAETATTEMERKKYLAKSINVSHEMAVKFIMEARKLGVKSIVAPYEADAQLAYLCRKNIVDYVITEDADLLPFGTPKVLYKLDVGEFAFLIERNDINNALKFPIEKYSFEKFRHICIISGCDYFPRIKRVGLITAAKMIKQANKNELSDFLAIYSESNPISQDKINQAIKADLTFQYQIVFDPISLKQVPLNSYPSDLNLLNLNFAGEIITDQKMVLELATGKRDPMSKEFVPNFDLDFQLLITSEVFYYGKAPNYQQKERAKSLPVKRQFPWKDESKSSEVYCDKNISDSKSIEILPFEKSARNNSSHLDNVLSKEENGLPKNKSLKRSRTWPRE